MKRFIVALLAPVLSTGLALGGTPWTFCVAAALGSKEQVDAVIEILDRLVESEAATARTLRERIAALNRKLMADVVGALDYAAASRRLRKRGRGAGHRCA